ncbi:MAG: 50S ribosomal protein L29 [Chloroflexota bacterium]
MANMLVRELRTKTDEELLDVYEDIKEELYILRINRSTGELVDTTEFRKTKRSMARVLTILRERELATMIAEEEAEEEA